MKQLKEFKQLLWENRRLLAATGLAIIAGIMIGIAAVTKTMEQEEGVAVNAFELVSVGAGTAISTRISFTGCRHLTEQTIQPAPYIGFTKEALTEAFPLFTIARFSSEEILLERVIAGCCEKHYLLKLIGTDNVAIQRFNTENQAMDNRVTVHINRDVLDVSTQLELDQGVVFDTMDEVNAYLESIES